MLISIDEKDNRPIYLQIIGQIKEQVGDGTLKPGDELPSVRELADSLGVNMHTVRSAYLKLRDQGIINLRLGRRAKIARMRIPEPDAETKADIAARFKELITDALLMGMSPDNLQKLVEQQIAGLKAE
jgi:DNA-binding transcriptional regulator YhcF (GntR family)